MSERIESLGLEKEEGIPTLSSILGLINIPIFERGNIREIDGLKDKGFPALCGLGKLPDPSFFYRFLQGAKTRGAEECIAECSKKFVETELNTGRVVNLDGKFLGHFGKKKLGKTKHPSKKHRLALGTCFYSLRPDYTSFYPEYQKRHTVNLLSLHYFQKKTRIASMLAGFRRSSNWSNGKS